MFKRAIAVLVSLICLFGLSTTVFAKEDSDLYYSKIGFMSEEYCQNMISWTGFTDIAAKPTSWGIRLTTTATPGANFFFLNQYDAQKVNWAGYKCAEISLTNEKMFGVNVGFYITENPTVTPDDPVEHFQLKAAATAYLVDCDGNASALTVDDNGSLYIPGNFMGKVYIPLSQDTLQSVKWATIDGMLDVTKITGISYAVNTQKSSIIIGDVRKSKIDPSTLAAPEPEESKEKEKLINGKGDKVLEGTVFDGANTAEGKQTKSSNVTLIIVIVSAVIILFAACAAGFFYFKKRSNRN
ncbi:MAG: hypothetical protein ACI4F7_10645 [Acutalibacteraceae bacterium]